MIPYRYYHNSYGQHGGGAKVGGVEADGYRDHIPSMDGYRAGDDLTLAWTGEIEGVSDPGFSSCEELFQLFNAPWERPSEYAGPSMSIGDVVVFFPDTTQQTAFACEREGFRKVEAKPLDSPRHPRPEHWKRDRSKLVEYLRAKSYDGESLTDEENALVYGE